MTIKEAFENNESISIAYVFRTFCPKCKKWNASVDEEYSFNGTVEYFTGKWQQEYGVMDLDDVVENIGENEFRFVVNCAEPEVCPECEQDVI